MRTVVKGHYLNRDVDVLGLPVAVVEAGVFQAVIHMNLILTLSQQPATKERSI